MCAASCVDGPRLARENVACRTEVACSHVPGLFTQSGGTAGPDGVRKPRPCGLNAPLSVPTNQGCPGRHLAAIVSYLAVVGSLADPIFAAFAGLNYSGVVFVMGGRMALRLCDVQRDTIANLMHHYTV